MINQKIELPNLEVPKLFLIPLGEKAKEQILTIAQKLRVNGIATLVELSGKKLNKAMQLANTTGALFTSVIGDEEMAEGKIKLKNMKTGETLKQH